MKRNILVTGGTVFVSRFVSTYFSRKGHNVYVLNRGSKLQVEGVHLIKADRHALGDVLKSYSFDAILDITGYTREDVKDLVEALPEIKQYIYISSGAVYPETLPIPFHEGQKCGRNLIWGDYGSNKLDAENYLRENVPQSYILRPPYLYGPMENLYREPFVFECADLDRPFYIPKDGKQRLQFFHVEDLCRFMELLMEKEPEQKIFNVGNPELVTIEEWAELCYKTAGKEMTAKYVDEGHNQRDYFSFYDYEYELDVTKQLELMPDLKSLDEGLIEAYEWYKEHKEDVRKKPFFTYIDTRLKDL